MGLSLVSIKYFEVTEAVLCSSKHRKKNRLAGLTLWSNPLLEIVPLLISALLHCQHPPSYLLWSGEKPVINGPFPDRIPSKLGKSPVSNATRPLLFQRFETWLWALSATIWGSQTLNLPAGHPGALYALQKWDKRIYHQDWYLPVTRFWLGPCRWCLVQWWILLEWE